MEADALGDTVSDAQPLVNKLADLRKQWSTRWLSGKQRWSRDARLHTEICAATGGHAGRLAQASASASVSTTACACRPACRLVAVYRSVCRFAFCLNLT